MNRGIRERTVGPYLASVLVLLGFIIHRLNLHATALEASARLHHFPKCTEIAIMASILTPLRYLWPW